MLGKMESLPQVLGVKGGAMQTPLSSLWDSSFATKADSNSSENQGIILL